MTARFRSALRSAKVRRRRQAASALLELDREIRRGPGRHYDDARMLVLGIDPRF